MLGAHGIEVVKSFLIEGIRAAGGPAQSRGRIVEPPEWHAPHDGRQTVLCGNRVAAVSMHRLAAAPGAHGAQQHQACQQQPAAGKGHHE